MKYKLINLQTKEEHLCDKVTIKGFDYYINDAQLEINDYCYRLTTNQIYIISEQAWSGSNNISLSYAKKYCKKIIATNNPNIDVLKVVDLDFLARENANEVWLPEDTSEFTGHFMGFKQGYNKSQETHPFSEEDMIEFAISGNYKGFTKEYMKEKIQLWKEQKPKTIYYE